MINPRITPRSHSAAEQCRQMGIRTGDTIVGRETYNSGEWSEAKLTLLWLGDSVAVWDVAHRNSWLPDKWQNDGEAANWTLDCRAWFRWPTGQIEN